MSVFLNVIFLLFGSSAGALAQPFYPHVDLDTQRARDEDRHLILSTEFKAEYQKLTQANAALTLGVTDERRAEVHRHAENVKALRRELDDIALHQPSPRKPVRLALTVAPPPIPSALQSTNSGATFWNPYNRAPDPEATADFSTVLRKEIP